MKKKYEKKVENKLSFLKDIESEIVATGNKFQLPKIDLSNLESTRDKEFSQMSTKGTTMRTTRREFYRHAASSSRAFFLK